MIVKVLDNLIAVETIVAIRVTVAYEDVYEYIIFTNYFPGGLPVGAHQIKEGQAPTHDEITKVFQDYQSLRYQALYSSVYGAQAAQDLKEKD